MNSPINLISKKPFYRIPTGEINPYSAGELESTAYVLGSPGSGKTRLLFRVRDETGGALAIESGVFELFQSHVRRYVQRKMADGRDDVSFADLDFDMPNIDGFCVYDNFMGGLEKEVEVKNAPYKGMGARHYRDFLVGMSSGGKSGFPDWIFIPKTDGKYVQVISFPGHIKIEDSLENKSIPPVPEPSAVIYLVDPNIEAYHHEKWQKGYQNPATDACHLHLANALELEGRGINVQWLLSKTTHDQLVQNRERAGNIYRARELTEIAKRVPGMPGFDSFRSSRDEIYRTIGHVIGL